MSGQDRLLTSIHAVVRILREETVRFQEPAVTVVAKKRDPFRVLISCLLSLRTKDEVTAEASRRLFALADTPEVLVNLSEEEIERAIFPVGFYKTKARTVKTISRELLDRYEGQVPGEIDELLTCKGVGRKTANLVVTLGFDKPGICVDTHVHRISNRLGWVTTKRPEETEMKLRDLLPQEYWIEINDLLVTYGQNICTPISPRCSICRIAPFCQKVGVGKSR
jgi:endonuclease-3